MNKILLYNTFCFLILTLFSCERSVKVNEELVITIKDELEIPIHMIVSTNGDIKQTKIDKHYVDSLLFQDTLLVHDDFANISTIRVIYVTDYKIYNLDDTCSIIYSELINSDRILFNSKIFIHDIEVNSYTSRIRRETLTIDSTLLPIFKKDYNMLEQFSEYYK